jgi:uncharacterized membrane protein YeaQ/YmgE (transglycosylase-associated protein family)
MGLTASSAPLLFFGGPGKGVLLPGKGGAYLEQSTIPIVKPEPSQAVSVGHRTADRTARPASSSKLVRFPARLIVFGIGDSDSALTRDFSRITSEISTLIAGRWKMIGMNFSTFVVLLAAGVIAAGVIHYVARYRFLEGFDGFLGKLIAGWVGAWMGSPIIGHWFERVQLANVYLVPALLGAFVAAFFGVATAKAIAKALAPTIISGAESHDVRRAA